MKLRYIIYAFAYLFAISFISEFTTWNLWSFPFLTFCGVLFLHVLSLALAYLSYFWRMLCGEEHPRALSFGDRS